MLGGIVVLVARNRRALSASGMVAATAVAIISTAAGWTWAMILIAFFVSATVLSRYRAQARDAVVGDMVAKGGERDARQVAANGGVFAAAAIASIVHPSAIWLSVGAGAIAASTADTWATEIGTLATHEPRLITTGRLVPTGTSGGVSWPGSLAGVAGAIFIGAVVHLAGWGAAATFAAIGGGVAGMLVDSLAGASIQSRRWCGSCEKPTERLVHSCGTTTETRGGIRWVDNDAVNAISSIAGAVAGSIIPVWLPPS